MSLREVEIDLVSTGLPPLFCPEDPRLLLGKPIGMYHCPWCGCMQIGGLPHIHEWHCWLGIPPNDEEEDAINTEAVNQ